MASETDEFSQSRTDPNGHHYRMLVESMDEGAATLTTEGIVVYANRRFAEILEIPLEQLAGAPLHRLIASSEECDIAGLLKQAVGCHCKVECFLRVGNGTQVPICLSFSPLKNRNNHAICLIATDLTEQKRKEKELAEMNRILQLEIVQRKRAEEALLRNSESLRGLSGRLLRLQDEERRRVARDLHDSTGQKLVALTLELNLLGQQMSLILPAQEKTLGECRELAEQVSSEIRTLSYLLHPPLLDEVGLSSAARWFVDGFVRRTKINVKLDIPSDLVRPSEEVELTLFRILQESLTNVHRHSGSSTAEVLISASDGRVRLEVRDHGRPDRRPPALAHNPEGELLGVGIRGMRERVRQLGGQLELRSGPEGTVVDAILPLGSEAISYLEDAV